jgi:hypothetical protein
MLCCFRCNEQDAKKGRRRHVIHTYIGGEDLSFAPTSLRHFDIFVWSCAREKWREERVPVKQNTSGLLVIPFSFQIHLRGQHTNSAVD